MAVIETKELIKQVVDFVDEQEMETKRGLEEAKRLARGKTHQTKTYENSAE